MAWDAGAITGTLTLDTSPFVTGVGMSTQLAMQAGQAIYSYLSGGFGLAAEYEKNALALEGMLGSADAAKAMMSEIQAFAAETPFESKDLFPVAKLLANTQDAEKIVPALRMIGDVAAGTGTNIGQIAFIYAQVATQGRAMTQDINQFTNAYIPMWKTLEEMTGRSNIEVRKMVEEGKIGFPEIEAAFRKMTSEGGVHNNMTGRLAAGYAGLFSTITDNMSILQMGIGQGVLEGLDIKVLMGDSIKFQTEVVPGIVASVSQGVRTFKSEIEPLLAILKYMYDYWVELRDFTGDLGESAGNLWVGASNLINGDPMAKGETRTKEQLEAGGDKWGVPPINVNLEVKATTDEDQAGQIGTEVGKKIAAQLRATKAAKKLGGKAS